MQALVSLRRRIAKFFREREDAFFFVLCGVVGIIGSLLGAAFRFAEKRFQQVFLPKADNFIEAMRLLEPWQRVAVPALGALLAGLILWLIRREPGGTHGVPDVMEVVVLGRKGVRVRNVLVRSIASFVGLVTGSSVGREGPLIALATASGARIGLTAKLSDESYR